MMKSSQKPTNVDSQNRSSISRMALRRAAAGALTPGVLNALTIPSTTAIAHARSL